MRKYALGICIVAMLATTSFAQYRPPANGYRGYAQTGFYTPPKDNRRKPMTAEEMIPSPSDDIEVIPTQPAEPAQPIRPIPQPENHQSDHSLMPSAGVTPAPYHSSVPSSSHADSYGATTGSGVCGTGGNYWEGPYGDCGPATDFGYPCGPTFFGGVGGLFMQRDQENEVWLSFNTADVTDSLLGSRDASMEWAGGVQADIGYCLGDGWGISARYWGIYPQDQTATAYDPDPLDPGVSLNTTFDLTTLNYDDGVNPVTDVNGWYDGAAAHRLRRSNEFHNLELNLINGGCCLPYDPCCRYGLRCSFLMGIRYFKFDESFSYASSEVDYDFNYGIDDLYYDIDVENNLLGFQVGGYTEWFVADCFTIYGGCKMGIYGNRINHTSWIGGANGGAFVGAGPNAGRYYDVSSSKNDVALLGELDFGAQYRINCNWSVKAGYRALGATGVALTTNQIPGNFADIDGASAIDSNGSLLLHGGYGGIEFVY